MGLDQQHDSGYSDLVRFFGPGTIDPDSVIIKRKEEASAFGESYDGFSAPELVYSQNRTFLITTPTENDQYRGCLVFRLTDLFAGHKALSTWNETANIDMQFIFWSYS